MGLREYSIRRLVMFIPILFGVSVLVFSLIHLVPGSPAVQILGVRATPERVEHIERELGLHRPLLVQYVEWLRGAIVGDLGTSYSMSRPVASVLAERFVRSFELVVLTVVLTTLISIPLGILAAIKQHSWVDYLSMGAGLVGISIPMFFSGTLLMAIFAVWFDLLPVSGYVPFTKDILGNLQHAFLPVMTMTIMMTAVTMRMMRSSMLENLHEDYVQFHKAKGLSKYKVLQHVAKNSFIPVVTMIGLQFGYLLSGTIVVEVIFAIPGIGRTLVQAVLTRDYPLVQGTILLIALWFATVNLLTDIVISKLNPRIMEDG